MSQLSDDSGFLGLRQPSISSICQSAIPIPLFPKLESLKIVVAGHTSTDTQRFRETFYLSHIPSEGLYCRPNLEALGRGE